MQLRAAVGKLFKEVKDPIFVVKWKEIYELGCCEAMGSAKHLYTIDALDGADSIVDNDEHEDSSAGYQMAAGSPRPGARSSPCLGASPGADDRADRQRFRPRALRLRREFGERSRLKRS